MPEKKFTPYSLERQEKKSLPKPEGKDPHSLGADIPIDQYEADDLLKKLKESEAHAQQVSDLKSRISELESLLSTKNNSLVDALSEVEKIKNLLKNDMLKHLKSMSDGIISSAISDRLPIVVEKMIMSKLHQEPGAQFYASEATCSLLNLTLLNEDNDLPDGVVVCVSKDGQRSVVEID